MGTRDLLHRYTAIAAIGLATPVAHGELVVNSSNGYQVHVYIQLTHVLPSSMSCPWGYNWNVALNYNIWFTGNNAPASMYTLQGTVGCGSTNLFFDLPNDGGSGSTITTSNPYRSQSDCATVNLGTLGCHSTSIQIHGPGIGSQVISYQPDVLPIELLAFNAVAEDGHVRLDWSTATETNNDHFTLERSLDGIEFKAFAQVPGAGNSQHTLEYAMIDHEAPEGLVLYRLKQTDLDGRYTYSPVVDVMVTDRTFQLVAPNPCMGAQFRIAGDVAGKRLEVRSTCGELVRSIPLFSNTVDRAALPAGIYLLSIQDPRSGSSRSVRLVLG